MLIASPGDVATERQSAREIVQQWNDVNSQDRSIVLLPVTWETTAAPAMGARAQEIINQQLVRDADLLIAMFWTRIGTPTGVAVSGTVEEIQEHLRAGKPAMIYFSTAPVRLDSVDEEQYRGVREFREWCRLEGLVEEYESLAQFRERLSRQLAHTVILRFPRDTEGPSPDSNSSLVTSMMAEEPETLVGLSPEGRELLRAAAVDANGTVIQVSTFGGLSVETGGRNFVESGNARSEAQWRQVVEDLIERGLLEQRDRNGEVFSVTDEGYRVSDTLGRTAG